MDRETLEKVMAECYLRTEVFSKTIFPERFSRAFTSLHDEIFNLLDDPSKQKVAIAAPRGFGKTSLMNLAYPAKKILFREKKFIVPISCTATQALMQGENLKRELLANETIRQLFGSLKSETFAKDCWITSNGIMILPRGAGQQVRGIQFDGQRPDLIVIDDLEDSEAVRSEEQRAKLKEWFFADLLNSIDRSSKTWKIVMIGTILHEDSLLANILDDPSWTTLRLELCDDNYHSNWPDFMSDDEVKELAEGYAQQGLLHVFAMEYRNTVIPIDAAFQQRYFKHYEEGNRALEKEKNLENFVIVDPAKTANMHSAYSAVVGIGVNTTTHEIFFRDCVNERLHPEELYQAAFDMCKRLKARVLAVEVTGLNEFITYPFKTWITKSGLLLDFVELKARGGTRSVSKEERIRALVPFYRQGLIWHNKSASGPLEAQLMSYPRSKYWDVMDAFAYIVELLEVGERYFLPSEEDDLAFDEEEFDYEPAMQNWRQA
jgi:hypothetical protein